MTGGLRPASCRGRVDSHPTTNVGSSQIWGAGYRAVVTGSTSRLTEGRRARNKRATRLALTAAARELIAEHGYDRVTAIDIAYRAGVSESTLFRYFPTKAALVVDEFIEVQPDLLAAIRLRPPSEPPYVAVYQGYRDFFAQHPDLMFTVAGPVWRDPGTLSASTDWTDRLVQDLTEVLTGRDPDSDGYVARVRANTSITAVSVCLGEAASRSVEDVPVLLPELFRRTFAALDPRVEQTRAPRAPR